MVLELNNAAKNAGVPPDGRGPHLPVYGCPENKNPEGERISNSENHPTAKKVSGSVSIVHHDTMLIAPT
ncbi:MAG: hypothetical protein V3T88_07950 [Nitrosomonadaceae bacterium]